MAKRKKMTAEEFMAQLTRDPEFLRSTTERDKRIREEVADLVKAEAPLVADFKRAGADVESVWDLVNSKERYPHLIQALLKHLNRDYPSKVREGIARALAVPEARVGWQALLGSFLAEPQLDQRGKPNQVKWALSLALAAAADESTIRDVIKIAIDRHHGTNRMMLVQSLTTSRDPRAKATLAELKDDPDLVEVFRKLARKKK